jgi:hypothetical protein
MPTYLYCLLSAGDEPPTVAVRGLDDQPVRSLDAGAVRAWVSDVAHVAPQATVERALAHDVVVRYALERTTPVPARFGQTFTSDAALVESVRAREAASLRALERVRGSVEMTVRLLPTAAVSAAPAASSAAVGALSGREYLARLRDRHAVERAWRDEAGFLQQRVANAVRGLVRGEVRSASRRPAGSVSVSHLVERDVVARYRAALCAVAGDAATSRVAISGPWAPYSFAEIGHV